MVAVAAALLALPAQSAQSEATLWKALRSGNHVALIRHAIAPGTGDPPQFVLRDCSTQRNLSDEGRDQAYRIGLRFRVEGIAAAQVFSSQWCRCLETASLLGLGDVQELPALNSFFSNGQREPAQTQDLRKWLASRPLKPVLVLVTHQVNITAISGVYPASGEVVIMRRGNQGVLTTLGSIKLD